MTQIEVPSWVVEVAQQAYYEHDDTGSCQYAMLKAITAALGAWVVPAGWMDPDDGSVVCEYHEHEPRYVSYTQPLFALRQEKPE